MIKDILNKINEKNNNEYEINRIKETAPDLILAMELFFERDNISSALLQRKFEIGFSRAARIIDILEDIGFISEMNAENKKRTFLITKEEFENELKEKLNQL